MAENEKRVADLADDEWRAMSAAHNKGGAAQVWRVATARMDQRVADLIAALRPFVAAYEKHSDPIGDSDLYDEQPVTVWVTLGDCRKAARVLAEAVK